MRTRTGPLEVALVSYLYIVGARWALPGDSWALSSFGFLTNLLAEWLFGLVWIGTGIIWIWAIRRNAKKARRLSAFGAGGLLIGTGVTFIVSNPASSLGPGLIVLGVSALWCYWQLSY